MEIISRKLAISRGLKQYFTARPCKHGHISERYVSGGCCECRKSIRKKYASSVRGVAAHKKYVSSGLGRAARLKYRYNLTESDITRMFEGQNYKCGICDKVYTSHGKEGLVVDHDHATNIVRGLLCTSCNLRLGWYENNKVAIKEYIKS